MSDITNEYNQTSHKLGNDALEVEVEENLDRAMQILAGLGETVTRKAVSSAIRRAMDSARAELKRSVTQEYTLSQKTFLANVWYKNSVKNDYSVSVAYCGHVIPLINFNTKVSSDGRVTAQVKRSSTPQALTRAFKSEVNGHVGIFEREGDERLPIKELYGPSVPQMMYSNEEVLDAATDKAVEVFDQRLDHEIDAFLNGWRQ